MVTERCMSFIDANYLRAEGIKEMGEKPRNWRLNGSSLVEWLEQLTSDEDLGTHVRTYWYDAQFEPDHRHADGQQRFFVALRQVEDLDLRLGQIVETRPWFEQGIRDAMSRTADDVGLDVDTLMSAFENHWTFRTRRKQKGVRSLMSVDLMTLCLNDAFDTAVMSVGDRDLLDAIQMVKFRGRRVVLVVPSRYTVTKDLAEVADRVIEMEYQDLETLFSPRPRHGS